LFFCYSSLYSPGTDPRRKRILHHCVCYRCHREREPCIRLYREIVSPIPEPYLRGLPRIIKTTIRTAQLQNKCRQIRQEGFESTTPTFQRKTTFHALDHGATLIGSMLFTVHSFRVTVEHGICLPYSRCFSWKDQRSSEVQFHIRQSPLKHFSNLVQAYYYSIQFSKYRIPLPMNTLAMAIKGMCNYSFTAFEYASNDLPPTN
jgi:hypothetical protein